jgi:hypothetical protein
VHGDVRDRLDIAFDDGGSQTLKNIARPVQIWHWKPESLLSTPAPFIRTVSSKLIQRCSVPRLTLEVDLDTSRFRIGKTIAGAWKE